MYIRGYRLGVTMCGTALNGLEQGRCNICEFPLRYLSWYLRWHRYAAAVILSAILDDRIQFLRLRNIQNPSSSTHDVRDTYCSLQHYISVPQCPQQRSLPGELALYPQPAVPPVPQPGTIPLHTA